LLVTKNGSVLMTRVPFSKEWSYLKIWNTPAGYHSIRWNATNDFGSPVSAGVYLYQLQAKDFVKTRKMILLK
jgi:flagellar hook assembly protein FlgD